MEIDYLKNIRDYFRDSFKWECYYVENTLYGRYSNIQEINCEMAVKDVSNFNDKHPLLKGDTIEKTLEKTLGYIANQIKKSHYNKLKGETQC